MQKKDHGSFQFDCIQCKHPVEFSLQQISGAATSEISCRDCKKKYGFQDETLRRQLKKFAALCQQIQESEEILGSAAVAVNVGPNNVKIPFKLLLCRLKSTLDLQIGKERFSISFRIEPATVHT
jgi:hypothetical protein